MSFITFKYLGHKREISYSSSPIYPDVLGFRDSGVILHERNSLTVRTSNPASDVYKLIPVGDWEQPQRRRLLEMYEYNYVVGLVNRFVNSEVSVGMLITDPHKNVKRCKACAGIKENQKLT